MPKHHPPARLDARHRLLRDPADADALGALLSATDDPHDLLVWARRVSLVRDIDPANRLRLVERAGALDMAELRTWANAATVAPGRPLSLIGAILRARPDAQIAQADTDREISAGDRFDWLRVTCAPLPLAATPASANDIAFMKIQYQGEALDTGRTADAYALGRELAVLARKTRQRFYGSTRRAFSANWVASIGHQVMFAHLMSGHRAGLFDWQETVLADGRPANDHLWSLMEGAWGAVTRGPGNSFYLENHSSLLPEVIGGRMFDIFDTCALVDEIARRAGHTVLPVPPDDGTVAAFLRSQSADPNRAIVTLHCREGRFKHRERHQLRNVEIDTYLPAIRMLVERGYTVVRVGDRSMTPLPPIDHVVDYAHSAGKSARLDILLLASAAFHIGSSSGLSLVPLLLARPCLFLNWYPATLMPWGRRTWTVMKHLRRIAVGKSVTDPQELYAISDIGSPEILRHLGYQVVDLDAREITASLCRFLDALGEPDALTWPRRLVWDDGEAQVDIPGPPAYERRGRGLRQSTVGRVDLPL